MRSTLHPHPGPGLLARLLATVAIAAAVLGLTASPAAACSFAPEFQITLAHLQAGDFNEPDSAMARDWADHVEQMGFSRWETAPVVLGAYVIETYAALDGDGPWTRGSVSAVAEIWGERPNYTRATKHDTTNHNVEPMDSCGFNGDGPELGTRRFFLVTDNGDAEFWESETPEDAFAEVFGPAELAERDHEQEAEMWQELVAKRQADGDVVEEADPPEGIRPPDEGEGAPPPSDPETPTTTTDPEPTEASAGGVSPIGYLVLGGAAALAMAAAVTGLRQRNQ